MKKVLLVFVLLMFSAQAKYEVAEFVLDNGLRIVCINKKTSPIIFFSVWYKCGSKCDQISSSGVAHYMEHMAFASNKMEFSNYLESIGASQNAFTSIHMICFYEIVPKENIEKVFHYEAERMKSFDIDDDVFLSEKSVILEERNLRIDNNPMGQQHEVLISNVFNRRIGGIEVIGLRHEIEAIKKEDLCEFHKTWFAPNNAIIVIAGDFDLDQIKALADKYWREILPKKIPNLLEKNVPSSFLKEIEYSSPKNGSFSCIEYLYRVPFLSMENFRKFIALSLAINMINKPDYFIKKVLKNCCNCASSIGCRYISRIYSDDIVSVEILSSNIDNLCESESIWRYLKNKITAEKIQDSELNKIKQQYFLSLAHRTEDIEELANHFGRLLIAGFPLDKIQSIEDVVQSISVKECNDVLTEVFSSDPLAISRIVPRGYDRD